VLTVSGLLLTMMLSIPLPQSERGLDAAVVELDPLPDPVRSASQNHHFPLLRFGSRFPAHRWNSSRGVGLELRGAGVHELVDGLDTLSPPDALTTAHRMSRTGPASHRKAVLLGHRRKSGSHCPRGPPAILRGNGKLPLQDKDLHDVMQKPGIDPGQFVEALQGIPLKGLGKG
jgi:hypothetical protein